MGMTRRRREEMARPIVVLTAPVEEKPKPAVKKAKAVRKKAPRRRTDG